MENPLSEEKKDLIKWISNLNDLEVLSELMALKENAQLSVVAESAAEYKVGDDFDERFAKGYTLEESRAKTKAFIRSLPWKN